MRSKGSTMEELVRNYFYQIGYFALRSIPYRFEGHDISDIDVWIYGRLSATARVRGVIDVKNKKSPKALERILWAKGIQTSIGCDKAIIATTDTNPAVAGFAKSLNVSVINKQFIERLDNKLPLEQRLSMEELLDRVRDYTNHKADGDWIRHIDDAKSSLIEKNSFKSFNRIMLSFQFFSERAEVRSQQKEIAIRLAIFMASLACIALDSSLESYVFDGPTQRHNGIMQGVTYGDSGDGKTIDNIKKILALISESMENGKSIASIVEQKFKLTFSEIRADIVAEYFALEHHSQHLFSAARQLEFLAHSKSPITTHELPPEAKSILGVFADFVGVHRSTFFKKQIPNYGRRNYK